ncbi:MAG: enoyl-CoA hydratase/isomerase family protein [Chloroflexi bacterium]|nr:enoyl-CoA hydratase/isomerase family protein [Chloroflexota bacterium]
MPYETIKFDKTGHKGIIMLNRPQALNSFNRKMSKELAELWQAIKRDDDVWVVVLTAAGDKSFCVGVDVKESTAENQSMSQFDRWRDVPGHSLTARQHGCWKPVITAVNGMCAGGGFYFVADSDIVICSDNATFFDPHVTYARVAAVEPVALTRRIPFGEVMRIALMGSAWRMDAKRAYQIGLVQEVVPLPKLMEKAHEMADVLAELPPLTLAGTVEAIWKGLEMDRQAAMDFGLLVAQRNTFTKDHTEGRRAFAEKRKPRYKNR